MQPIRTDKSEYYTDMNSFIRRLIKEGYKKILIGSCNPGSHKLDKDIMMTPGVTINYSDYSNIIESANIIERSKGRISLILLVLPRKVKTLEQSHN